MSETIALQSGGKKKKEKEKGMNITPLKTKTLKYHGGLDILLKEHHCGFF